MQCLPLGVLQTIYAVRMKSHGVMATLSYVQPQPPSVFVHIRPHALCRLVTTWTMFGMKTEKVGQIPTLWKYRTKQKKKVAALELQSAAPGGLRHLMSQRGCA